MAEPDASPEVDQLRCLGRRGRVRPDAELLGRAPEQRDVANRFGGRRQHELFRLGGERLEPAQEGLFDPP